VLGLVLVLVARTLRKGHRKVASEISQEMRDIEETYCGKKAATPVNNQQLPKLTR
jgi:hypothetical protein